MKFLIVTIQCALVMSWLELFKLESSDGFDPKKIPYNCGEKNILSKGAASRNRLWPNGVIYYNISSSFNSDQIRTIEDGFKMIEDSTRINNNDCVVFRKRTNEINYIQVENGQGCSSYVGMIGGAQVISLQIPGCVDRSVAAHEAIHALGFNHEHQRPDRDNYITVFFNNVITGNNYDVNSIMHYTSDAFSINPNSQNEDEKYTILSKTEPRVIRYNAELTETDIEEIRNLYKCSGSNEIISTTPFSTRTTRKTTTGTNGCQNLVSDSFCERNSFYCNWQGVFVGDMEFYTACKKTCNRCDSNLTTRPQNCVDTSFSCAFLANFCSYLKNLSPHPCSKTCKVC
ncbi:zinc metallo ase nas-4-like [Brachionus plicatilis]|uniref:Metalloendopeptidase n=1 Tax=Brachionus plicatilis TaxID=10195 RepID=A0A3M7S9D8_BRAPC|nr:zinc metallo ase nas-4-like [Brachionus plicatilis]